MLWYTSDRKAKVYRNTRKGRGETVMMRHRLQHWEQQTLLWFQEHLRRSWLTAAMKIATFLGNGGILWLTACACLLVRQQTRRAALTALLSLVFSALVCNALLKNLVERARPFDKIPGLQFLIRKPHDFSFPSGSDRVPCHAAALVWADCAGNRSGDRFFPDVSGRALPVGCALRYGAWDSVWIGGADRAAAAAGNSLAARNRSCLGRHGNGFCKSVKTAYKKADVRLKHRLLWFTMKMSVTLR